MHGHDSDRAERESVPTPSGANQSLAALTLMVSTRRTAMLSKALKEQSCWWESGQSLTGVAPGHPCSSMRRKTLTLTQTSHAAANLDRKYGTDFPQIEFFCLFRVRTIWVACYNFLIGVSAGRIRFAINKRKSRRGWNWTVWR